MINYNLFVRESVRKKERTKYNLIKTKNLRKKGRKEELQLDKSKGESEREIKQEVEAIGERARKKETIKQKRGMG